MNNEDIATPVIRSNIKFPVVGIGASAGGLAALIRLFENMPADNGMAFVIVVHLSPKHESNIAKLLQRVTKMKICQVTEPEVIKENHIYVIPPSKNLLMMDGQLIVEPLNRPRGKHVAIDLFLRTLAETHEEKAVAIVLSGTGSDGAVGVTRIKEKGGITVAQEPNDAEYDGMPRSALETGIIDFVLPIADIPQKLIDLTKNIGSIVLPQAETLDLQVRSESNPDAAARAERALVEIMNILRARTGHDFMHYKKATVLRRIERRMQVNCLSNLDIYLKHLETHQEETPLLLQDMLISVTNFFRDREAFESLERDIVPRIFADADPNVQIRAWTAGCATGEEAYSLAMLMAEQRTLHAPIRDIQVFATDIDERAIAMGRRGTYPESIVTDIPPGRLRNFFVKDDGHYQIKKDVREKVLFAAHNILRDPPFSRVHLISCRNLLIYLNREVQQRIFEMFHFSLLPGGFLFLGSSESADVASKYFAPVDKKNRIYRALITPQTTHYVSALPSRPAIGATSIGSTVIENKPRVPYADFHRRLVEQYAPPSVLVNREGDIVHLSDNAGKYFRYVGGEPSHNIVTLVVPELRLELRTALFQIAQNGADLETRSVLIQRDAEQFNVNLTMRRVQHDRTSGELILVLFNEASSSLLNNIAPDASSSVIAKQLENELAVTKEQLQNTIEQYETSAEELKASNEELQAINEELRSTTEELETSKEELQSINEELITVNHELKMKVDETGKTNDDLQNFISATEIATIFVDRLMRIKRYTPHAAEIFNLIASDIGRPLLDITHCLDYELLEQDAADVFDTLRVIEREVESDNGNWYISRLIPYRTTEDRIDGLVLTFINITSLHTAQQKLYEKEQHMRLVAASTRDYAIITQDTDGCVTSWNSGAQRIFGYSEVEMIGESIDILFTPEDIATGEPLKEREKARVAGHAEDERWHMRKDGSRFYCSGVTTVLGDGEMVGFAKIARDLTDVKEAESQREEVLAHETQVRRQAELTSRMQEEFLAVLSHELKQPLNLIHLNAELLSRLPETRESSRVHSIAGTIRSAVISQATLINDLLDLSRVRTGKLRLSRTPVDFAVILKNLVQAFSKDAENKNIQLINETAGESIIIDADSTRLEQIIWNLLSNAIKFTPQGGTIVVAIKKIEANLACLTVSDNGKGIAPEYLPYIFDMFNQADSITTRDHGGLGIGLALVKQLAESHGGYTAVRSQGLGHGAEFEVCLPICAEKLAAKELPPPDDTTDRLRGKKILLVDDDIFSVQAFAELLKEHGADVTCAASAQAALDQIDQHRFDLIVSDIGMPVMDGYALLSALRQLPNAERTPVVALTGFSRIADIDKTLSAGFVAHLQKPVSFDEFSKILQMVMSSYS
jgi:two-component system CheB/CheR fusion protein